MCILIVDENKLILCVYLLVKIFNYRGFERGLFFFIVWIVERVYVFNFKMKIFFFYGFYKWRLEVCLCIVVV